MLQSKIKSLCFVVYDSIFNSVFQSQVLTPLLAHLDAHTYDHITLVSYEPSVPSKQSLAQRLPVHPNLTVIILKRPPFVGTASLWLGIAPLKKIINRSSFSAIMARGPLAGWIAQRCTDGPITIQARGLCAEEHRYTHAEKVTWWQKPHYWLHYKALYAIEQDVYDSHNHIEAVSPALKDYLIKQFGTQEKNITIATHDIPKALSAENRAQARTRIRTELAIADNAVVYCYSGSYKPWQCAEETVSYFIEQYGHDASTLLLILSPDTEAFTTTLKQHNFPMSQCRIVNVAPHKLLDYLAAANVGFLFRHPDIINWVSRPTKVLEYNAAGLRIVHNGTVAYCVNQHIAKD